MLARYYAVFDEKYDADVKESLNKLGFKGYKKPISMTATTSRGRGRDTPN